MKMQKMFVLMVVMVVLSVTAAAQTISAPDVVITKDNVNTLIELPLTVTMPEGGNFTNIQIVLNFPKGVKPCKDDYDSYGFGGDDIPVTGRQNTPVVSFSDNMNNESDWPVYTIFGNNGTKTKVETNPCHVYTVNIIADETADKTADFGVYMKYTDYDNAAFEYGASPAQDVYEFVTLCNVKVELTPSVYDLNEDWKVDDEDYTLLERHIVRQADYDSRYDLDGNVTVDALDVNLELEELNRHPSKEITTYHVNGVDFKMVSVLGGTYTMGATIKQGSDATDSEKPAHQVTVSSFSIGQIEVTQALWQAVMGSNPSDFSGDLQHPVEMVSYNDCLQFITKLNQLTGKQFRLPTEAEWEYAARGGIKSKDFKYAGSDDATAVSWCSSNAERTQQVAQKNPNELGLYDMSGNVWEWCSDWYGVYSSEQQTNPEGPDSGSNRVCRGGGWHSDPSGCRVTSRTYNAPTKTNNRIGFRLVL